MIAHFYQNYSGRLLLLVALSFPLMVYHAKTIPVNNDIEAWLPGKSEVRTAYNEYKKEFGGEEIILVALDGLTEEDPLIESLRHRIEKLPGIHKCYSPQTLKTVMQQFSVSEEEANSKLRGFLISNDQQLVGMVATLTREGLVDRNKTVEQIHQQLKYCQLEEEDYAMAGSPVMVAELDRLGGSGKNNKYFALMLAISLALLLYAVRHWKVAFSIFGLTLWAMYGTMATIKLVGGEKNFILSALTAMVLVFTLATSIHFLHYYRAAWGKKNPLIIALQSAWKPCFLATFTTIIGLASLAISDFSPVVQFGWGACIGAAFALLTGLGLTPAVLSIWPNVFEKELAKSSGSEHDNHKFEKTAGRLLNHGKLITGVAIVLVAVTSIGMLRLTSKIDPKEFLPKENKVLTDLSRIEQELTPVYSIEAVVEFNDEEMPFMEKLDEIRRLEAIILAQPGVAQTKSAATFFPEKLPDNPYELAAVLKKAESRKGNNDYLSDGDRLWRISAGYRSYSGITSNQLLKNLQEATAGAPIRFTGISPLIENAQLSIFNGFWESFTMAFAIITVVMVISLKSLKLGIIAMIPNLTPICIVYGMLGWLQIPVDIGMMMTGSIALGIAVDGTFHFLVRFNEQYTETGDSSESARSALAQTGAPIFEAALIGGIGMLALSLSSFAPTSRFGLMMTALLTAALVGDLVLLPAVLSFLPRKEKKERDITEEIPSTLEIRKPRLVVNSAGFSTKEEIAEA